MAKPKKTVSKNEADKTTADQTPPAADKATTAAKAGESKPIETDGKRADALKSDGPKTDAANADTAKTEPTEPGKTPRTAPGSDSATAKPTAASDLSRPDDKAPAMAESATDPKSGPTPDKDNPKVPTKAEGPSAATNTKPVTTSAKEDPKATSNGTLSKDKVTPPEKPAADPAPSRASAAATKPSDSTSKPASTKTEKPSDAPSKPSPTPTPTPAPAPKERKRSVFFPMLLGGAIAAGLGFAASEYDVLGTRAQSAADLQSALEAQQARIADLEARADEPAALPENLPQVDALSAELTSAREELSALQTQLAEIDNRLTTVEKQPVSGGENEIAVAAFEREMEALRASVAEQRSEIESLLDNAQSAEEATAAAAEAARAQTAMTQMNAAISAGRPFETALAELQEAGVEDIPQALSDTAAGGVVTLANLQARYPDAARQALATARAAVPEEGEGGFGSFLKRQLGARSVAPRDGTDADAVLSRAEAAVRDGRLTDALAEIDTLPAPAQDAMAEWLADARARQAAKTAADELSQRLTAN
ncbi:hypothetical protein K3759_00610 [Sulfitobacter sp. W027]|uniref:hypothetical protein n=1 Tax=Sulfitobacter sp. W027 TaxID=2867025 RepID=UPI0021A79821|nr:hypothetical protein [Sulfitobacter sp. W027]UWR33632.1 hypothetical protein K3759_00610 [Sulfitobacter sp. W027]